MDIESWLREIGMSEHWGKFQENKIDEAILKSLKEDDLRNMGIEALGDRKRIQTAIQKLLDVSNIDERMRTLESRVYEKESRAHISIPITSLVTGIMGFLTLFDDSYWDLETVLGVFSLFCSPSIAFGIVAMSKNANGKGMGVAGFILGILTLFGVLLDYV